mgnify:CR=1 FL=1
MQLCKQHGHDVVALANLLPEESAPDELDSFCFQTVGCLAHLLRAGAAVATGRKWNCVPWPSLGHLLSRCVPDRYLWWMQGYCI